MGYDLKKIEYVKAVKVPMGNKTDVQVQVKIIIKLQGAIDLQNISVKLVSNDS
jgi:R.HinP1I restriction endonuclease